MNNDGHAAGVVENTTGSCSSMFCCCCDHLMSLQAFRHIAFIVMCARVRVRCFNDLHVFVASRLESLRVQDVNLRTDCGSWREKKTGRYLRKKNAKSPSAKIIVRQKALITWQHKRYPISAMRISSCAQPHENVYHLVFCCVSSERP